MGLDLLGLGCDLLGFGLACPGFGWAGLGLAGLCWAGLGLAGLGWAGLGLAGLGLAGLGWAWLGWAGHSLEQSKLSPGLDGTGRDGIYLRPLLRLEHLAVLKIDKSKVTLEILKTKTLKAG